MKRTDENWLLKVSNLTKIYGEPDENTIWFAPQKPELAKLDIGEKVAKYFLRKQIFPAQVILAIKDNGNVVITAEFSNKEDFFEQAGRWMPFISVIEPQAYRNYICEKAWQTLEVNQAL